jgi:type IV pilus assembly protein PilC
MAKFLYLAKGPGGRELKGEIEASTEQEARVKLRAQRMVPLKVVSHAAKKATSAGVRGRGIPPKELQIFTRQLSTLLGSGIPIMQSLDVLGSGARNTTLKSAVQAITNSISGGKRLGDSLGEHPRIFDRFYVNMVRAGEESGNLDQILQRLALYIEKAVKIQSKVKGALVYPGVIVGVAMLVVTGLMIFVIPKFESLFAASKGELPALTKIIVAVSKFFISYWYLIFGGVILAIFALIKYYQTPPGRKVCDQILIRTPLFGDLIQKSGIARMTRTMSTLLGSGVGIIDALDIASKTTGNHVLETVIARAKDSITEGKSLMIPFSKEKYIPSMVLQMIGVGEQTGSLDQMLGKIADFYEDEVDVAVGALTSVIEPLLMVVLGAIIAFIVVAMYLPIFNLASAVG